MVDLSWLHKPEPNLKTKAGNPRQVWTTLWSQVGVPATLR